MKNPDEKKRLKIAAYREGAHAVACYLLHKRFKCVSIYRERMRVEEILFPEKISKSFPSARELKFFEREHMVFLAGLVAERILSGTCDFEDILPLLVLPLRQKEDSRWHPEIFWRIIFIETKLLMYMPKNWQAVITLAEELLTKGRIGYHAARKIIRQALEDYKNGVRNEINAIHYSEYSNFVKMLTESRRKAKENINKLHRKLSKEDLG